MTVEEEPLAGLPELPVETFENLGSLDWSSRGPYVTVHPRMPDTPPAPPPRPHGAPRSSTSTQRYFTQAIYPRVFCYDPGPRATDVAVAYASARTSQSAVQEPEQADDAPAAATERTYRLSTLKSVSLERPLFCSVRSGPWLAEVRQTKSCIDGEADRWEFFIVEVPEVAVTWWGSWQEMPSVPSLTVITNDLVPIGRATSSPCPGYKWCPALTSYIPQNAPCADLHPV